MINYSTNWMGPINLGWIERNGDCWSAGRIDIRGIPNMSFREEICLPPMHTEDWNLFSDWLFDYTSIGIQNLDQLLEQYYLAGNTKIRWLTDEC